MYHPEAPTPMCQFGIAQKLEPLARELRADNIPIPETTMILVVRIFTLMGLDKRFKQEDMS